MIVTKVPPVSGPYIGLMPVTVGASGVMRSSICWNVSRKLPTLDRSLIRGHDQFRIRRPSQAEERKGEAMTLLSGWVSDCFR